MQVKFKLPQIMWKILKQILKRLRNLRVISNTSPLIYLSKIGRLELLHHMFDTVYIPGAVKGSVIRVKIDKISGTVAFGQIVT